jgi:glycosyltransferase involved in cell wall biosynthesis
MRVALVHDWLNGMRGGEKVLEQLCALYPGAPVSTLLYEPDRISDAIRSHPVRTSFIQSLPLARAHYRWYLPLFPAAIEHFNFAGIDLVVSSSHCVALGALAPASAVHVCYCHTPMRYAWEHFHTYFPPERYNRVIRGLIAAAMTRLRTWDVAAAQRVGVFVANSACVARRIGTHYRRSATVVHPPVDTEFYTPGGRRGDYDLIVSALVPYKRVDLAIEAYNRLKRPLVVVGEGPERRRLEAMAGPTVRFLGWQTDEAIRDHYRAARAFIFPGEEDFGITPVEATACGTPVLAFASGGALETVREGLNGLLFPEQTVDSLVHGIASVHGASFDPAAMRAHALEFSRARFRERFSAVVAGALHDRQRGGHAQLPAA